MLCRMAAQPSASDARQVDKSTKLDVPGSSASMNPEISPTLPLLLQPPTPISTITTAR